MATASQLSDQAWDEAMIPIFTNGNAEAGLEAEAEVGLGPDRNVRIPKSMVRFAAIKVTDASWAHAVEARETTRRRIQADNQKRQDAYDAADPKPAQPPTMLQVPDSLQPMGKPAKGDSRTDMAQLPGWTTGDRIRIYQGIYSVEIDGMWHAIHQIHQAPATRKAAMDFYTVNLPQLDSVAAKHRDWVQTIRYWAVVSGFVVTSKMDESSLVDDPVDVDAAAAAWAATLRGSQAGAWTAIAARATNWRKSNHATGGDIAAGFAQKVLAKAGMWSTVADVKARAATNREATTAFYVATHAASPHAVLAMMAPKCDSHWAITAAAYGIFMNWVTHPSVLQRMEPNTQVAGAAVVVDAVVVLKMLIQERLSPMLTARGQIGALMEAHRKVEAYGMMIAVYADWFLDGHPGYQGREPFSQKDATFFELAAELGVVASRYYPTTTIGASPSLRNAAAQAGSENANQVWTALSDRKRVATATQLIAAYDAIKGAASSSLLAPFSSDDEGVIRGGVGVYNELLSEDARAVGMSVAPTIDPDVTLANAAKARQAALADAAGSAM